MKFPDNEVFGSLVIHDKEFALMRALLYEIKRYFPDDEASCPHGVAAIISFLSGKRKKIPERVSEKVTQILQQAKRPKRKVEWTSSLQKIASEQKKTQQWMTIDYQLLYQLIVAAEFQEKDFTP